uniref:serine-rich adhesin for platelets n=1 Tax=Semicossyphus pulcher TaxID=241346 RepID=UPI0037E92D57
MAKSSPRKSLKSLFSRSEANLGNSVEKDADKNEGERKRFRFFRFRRRSNNASATDKPANETQQVLLSPVAPTKEDREAWAKSNIPDNKKSSLYATAPRSKAKELSYSDLDLRKPRRFSTFSFGLRKRKKKNEESLSKSAFGLHSTGIEEQEEPPPDLSQVDTKRFSMSQPVLDTSIKFDIPSPPPVATNQSESYFSLPELQLSDAIHAQPEAEEPLKNATDLLDVDRDQQKAPIATIPELQLDSLDSYEEKENIPVHDNLPKGNSNSPASMTYTENTCAVEKKTVPTLQANQPATVHDTADLKEAVVDSVPTSNRLCDFNILQHTETEISRAESTTVTSSQLQPDAPDVTDSTTPNAEAYLASVVSEIEATISETQPVPALKTDSASVRQEVSISHDEKSNSESAESVDTTSAFSGEKDTQPVTQNYVPGDDVYEALYESLFPQNFTSEVMSSLSNPPPEIHTEIQHSDTSSEPVVIKTFDECLIEGSVTYSSLSTSRELYSATPKEDDAVESYTNMNATYSEREVIPSSESYTFTSYQTSNASEPLRDADIPLRDHTSSLDSASDPADSSNITYSELTRSLLEVKADSSGLIQDTARPASVFQSSAPPVSDCVTSQGTDAQVTDSIRRVILVKELVTDEASSVPGCTSPGPEIMDSGKDLELNIETIKSFSAIPSGQMSGSDGFLSPTYLSVGSDDSSAIEIYYSAEEDNIQDSGDEQVCTMDDREEIYVGDRVREIVGLSEEYLQQKENAETDKRDEGGRRVLIVKLQGEQITEEKKEDISSPTVYHQSSETWSSVFLEGNDLKSQEKEVATTGFPQVEGEVKELKEFVGLREDFSMQGEIAEREIRKRDEEGPRVLIIKMQDVESNDNLDVDISSPTEVQQQLRSQSSETWTPDVLEGNDMKSHEKEVATTTFPQVEEEVKELEEVVREIVDRDISQTDEGGRRVVIVKMQNEESNDENNVDISSQTQVHPESSESLRSKLLEGNDAKSQEKELSPSEFSQVEEVVKEIIRLSQESLRQADIEERDVNKQDEDGLRVVLVKMQNEESNDENKDDISSQTEVHLESSETFMSRILEGNDARSQKTERSTTEFPQVEEVVKEIVELGEEFSKQTEMEEREINNRDEGGLRVVFVELQNEGENEENRGRQMDVQQQLRGQSSETWTSVFLQGNDAKSQGKEAATTAFPKVEEGVKETKEVVWIREEFSKQGGVEKREINKRDEEGLRMVLVNMQKDGSNEEKKEDTSRRTEVQQQLRGQSSETQTSEFLEGNDAKSQEKEVATTVFSLVEEEGQEVRWKELLATPVGQVKTLLVCDSAPPSRELHGPGEGSKGNRTKELETEDHRNREPQLPGQQIEYLAYKDLSSSEYIQAPSSNTTTQEDTVTPLFREAEELVLLPAEVNKRVEESSDSTETNTSATTSSVTDTRSAVEVVTATLTHSSELQSDATEVQHNRAPQRKSEWVDTITESTGRTTTVQEQVVVELSVLIADTHLPDTEAADGNSEKQEHPAETRPDLNEGTLTASRTPTAAPEISASDKQPTEADQESDDNMNSGYSSLSTKLSVKSSSPPKDEETRYRVHKMSLVSESEGSQDTGDLSNSSSTVTESNGSDVDSQYRWKNRFEGVSQYKPHTTGDVSHSDSLSYTETTSFSSSSALPEATAYKHVDNALSSSSSFSPASEEHISLASRLSDRSEVYLSRESEPAGERTEGCRRGLVEREEPAAPAGERESQREGESERFKSRWESHQSPESGSFSPKHTSYDRTDSFTAGEDSDQFTGVFKATLVELVSDPVAPTSVPPASPEVESPHQFEMDSLVDTLKSMGPSMRPRTVGLRAPPPVLVSSLPPIVEDAPSPVSLDVRDSISSPLKKMEAVGKPAESLNGLYTLPAELGLKRSTGRDSRSPLELMKQSQQLQESHMNLPLRASATNSIVMRTSPEDLQSPLMNGNGGLQSPSAGSRLDNSVIFGSYRAGSIDLKQENRQAHRPLFRASSLPETGLTNDRLSLGSKDFSDQGAGTDPAGSRFDRFSFLLNNSPSASGSLTGAEDPNARMSRPPVLSIGSPTSSNSPTRLLSPTGSIDLHRQFTNTESPLSVFGQNQNQGMGMGMGVGLTPLLQRSFSSEGTVGGPQTSLFNSMNAGSQFQSQEQELDRNLISKYRAFPDAYLTKEKEHGKLNPRPGKIYIFDQPGMCGQRIEVHSDIIDATAWELQETISIRVVRGGWVLYEHPHFKGEKVALDEGDIELTYPFGPPEEEQPQNGQTGGVQQNGEQNGETSEVQTETKPTRRFVIGSLRRAVRDYSVPEISLFPEENAEGKKVIFRDTSDDARIFGFPIKANSIIINAGLWLVYAHPFFQGVPRVLEVGGYTNPAAWGVEKPYVGSLHPLKVGEPRVENLSEPKMVIYEKPYFTGKSRTITANMRDFMTRMDRQQTVFMYSVGSLKVHGGIWVGYEKDGFRGHQYLLEEGEYHDWRVWGGSNSELRSARVIRADLSEPLMVMFEQPEEDQEGMQEENTFEVTEAIPDVELFGYKTSTRSIHVLSGAWIAYSHVDFSGNQYILEKGFYNNCADWGSQDTRVCSAQPILLAPSDNSRTKNEVILYSEPDFQGECHIFDLNQEALPEKLSTKSCRVCGGSWVLYEDKKFSGNLYVLSEGDYPNLDSMGCQPGSAIRSVKVVPISFSVPSISLFGLDGLEGREITMDTEIHSMVEEGFNNHILSVRVNSGCWVICEHSNYRGRQFLLEPIEITNWLKFSSLQTIGSMFPVRQKRHFFRIKNKERGHFLSIQGGVEELKSGRVVVTPEVEGMSDIWYYQDGFIKSKMSPTMSLQVMGNIEPLAKVVLWTETRQPIQTWAAKMRGLISSRTFNGMVLDVKGGKTYDKDHVVIMAENEERPSQQWEIELL